MPDEVVTMVTRDIGYTLSTPHTTILTGEQQAYFLFGLIAIFFLGIAVYFYLNDKREITE